MRNKERIFLGLSEQELSKLDDKELETYSAKMVFVRDAMPDAWLSYGEELMESAEILWTQSENGLRLELEGSGYTPQLGIRITNQPRKISTISRSYTLLAGFAIENIIKGLLVSQNPIHINSGKLSNDLKSHNLLRLASKVKRLSLDKKEERICQIMQDAIPYWGRYPIPLEYNGVMPEVAVDNKFRQVFLKLHFRLGKQLYKTIRNGWDSEVGPQTIKMRSVRYGDKVGGDQSLFD